MRAPYEARVSYGVPVPPVMGRDLDGSACRVLDGVVVGAFHPAAAEMGVWQRLLDFQCILMFVGCKAEDVGAVIPPSRTGQVLLVPDSGKWEALIRPDRPDRAFGMLSRGTQAEMLVIGAPTEDVWEEFNLKRVGFRYSLDLV